MAFADAEPGVVVGALHVSALLRNDDGAHTVKTYPCVRSSGRKGKQGAKAPQEQKQREKPDHGV